MKLSVAQQPIINVSFVTMVTFCNNVLYGLSNIYSRSQLEKHNVRTLNVQRFEKRLKLKFKNSFFVENNLKSLLALAIAMVT